MKANIIQYLMQMIKTGSPGWKYVECVEDEEEDSVYARGVLSMNLNKFLLGQHYLTKN